MRYMLLFHYPEETEASIGTEAIEAGQRALASYARTLEQAGILADLLARLGRRTEAIEEYDAAAELAEDPAVRSFLRARGKALSTPEG